MNNLINWIEIPAKDIKRAIAFYKAILGVDIHEADMFGTKIGLFPSDGSNVSGAIVQGDDYVPSTDGIVAYLNGGDDLQTVLDKVGASGGKVIVPKTRISPDMGYFGMFIDCEGNRMAVHSMG